MDGMPNNNFNPPNNNFNPPALPVQNPPMNPGNVDAPNNANLPDMNQGTKNVMWAVLGLIVVGFVFFCACGVVGIIVWANRSTKPKARVSRRSRF